MDLPAMVRLVVEEVGYQEPQRCRHLAIGGTAEPGEVFGEPSIVDLRGPTRDVRIGPFIRGELLEHLVIIELLPV